jgi:hypothetical protein
MPTATRLIVVACATFALTGVHAQGTGGGCDNCGKVVSIRAISDQATSWQPLGTTVPSTLSDPAQVGRTTTTFQVGKGGSNDGVVMLGAAGGATYARRPERYQRTRWEVTVQMDNGTARVVAVDYEPLFQQGDRVQVYGRQIDLL